MKLKIWSRADGWKDVSLPITANFRGLRILKGSVCISPEELEEALNSRSVERIQEALRTIRYATIEWKEE